MTPRTGHQVLASLAALVMLAGCSSGSDKPESTPSVSESASPSSEAPSNPLVGTYSVTSKTVKSTIDINPVGSGGHKKSGVFFSCWDSECATLGQRGYVTAGWLGQTFHLTSADDGAFEAEHVRTGPCGGGVEANFKETFTISWKAKGDGLTGTALQSFGGCDGGKDVKATYQLSGKRKDIPQPYQDDATAGELTDALNAFDPLASKLSSTYVACFKAGASAAQVAGCKAKAYGKWLGAAPAAVKTVTDISGEEYCDEALGAVKADKAVTAVRKAETANDKVAAGGSAGQATQPEADSNTALGDLYGQLVLVATMCVPPQNYADLGKDGVMAIDVRSSYIPPLEG